MPQFEWSNTPRYGGCIGCGTSANDKGFVDTFAETNVRRDEFEITGVVDVIFCADCVLQMSRMVGAATPAETEAFAQREFDLLQDNEKLKDEIAGWQQRFLGLANLDVEDFEKLAKLERASRMEIVQDAPSEK